VSGDIATLLEQLEAARVRHAQDKAAGAIDALGAVIHYLREQGATEGHTLPLMWLAYDYTDKTPGNVKPLFDAGREAIAAAAIDALMQTGLTEKAASVDVSKAMGGAKTDNQLRDWRGNVREGKTRAEAREQYHRAKLAMNQLREGDFAAVPVGSWRKGVLAMVAESYGIKKA
jgi:hypothetical protein